jgi:hypothetical protein
VSARSKSEISGGRGTLRPVNLEDLAQLPTDVLASARVYTNGEVSWPIGESERAIDGLCDAGFVILGLDVRRVDGEGRTSKVAWSYFAPSESDDGPTNVARSREEALEALHRADAHKFLDRILITWDSSRSPAA